MAREVLGGPAQDGKSSYQVALNICERCGRGSQDARGESIELDEVVVEMARCDAQHIGGIAPRSTHVGPRRDPPDGHLGVAQESDAHVGAGHESKEKHLEAYGETDDTKDGQVNGAASGTHVGSHMADTPHANGNDTGSDIHPGTARRATQSIPPALRRKVMRRDHGRCVVPGCRHATFVDVHHIETRADGGTHHEDNLVVVCSAHHRALHRGQLAITGDARDGLVFRRADGRAYGALDSPRTSDACERALRGLRGMGFGERESRQAIEQSRSTGDTETVLREALALLTTGHAARGHRHAS